jgi:hypothetical protein
VTLRLQHASQAFGVVIGSLRHGDRLSRTSDNLMPGCAEVLG